MHDAGCKIRDEGGIPILKSHLSYLKSRVFILLLIISLCIVSSAECYTLSISHLPRFYKGQAFLIISDISGVGPSVEVNFYDEYGKEISSVNKLLAPKGKINIEIADYLKSSGSIILESQNEMIVAEYWLIYKDGTASMIPLRPALEDERYFVNCLRLPLCEESVIAINDPKGNGPLIQIELYSVNGKLIKITRKMLHPHGILTFKVSDYADKNAIGKVSIRSFGGSISPYAIHIYGKKILWTFPALVPSKNYVIDGVSVDKESISSLAIVDVSAKGTRIRISIFNNNGEQVALYTKTLLPNNADFINLSEFANDIHDGTLRISSDFEVMVDYWEGKARLNDIRINSVLKNPVSSSKGMMDYEGILLSSYYSFNDNAEYWLSFINTGQEPILTEYEFYNDDGNRIGSKRISLEPYKLFRESIGRYFGNAKLGTIIIRDPSSDLLATLNIVNAKGDRVFGKIHAISR